MSNDRFPPFDIHNRIAGFARSAAGHVILTVALLDQVLEALILAYLPKMPDDRAEVLFSHPGPLSSLPAKNRFAYAVGLIGADTYQDLKGVTKVRNAFAHARGILHFDNPELAEVFISIRGWPSTDDLRSLFDAKVSDVAETVEAKYNDLIFGNATK
jgi:DNA-binding MltR family transcriptional regulator